MTYNFDQPADRRGTNSVKWEFIIENEQLVHVKDFEKEVERKPLLPLWVADMDFPCPAEVVQALEARASQGIFGYTAPTDSYYASVQQWMAERHNWGIKREWFCITPGVVPALNILVNTFVPEGKKVLLQPPVYHPFYHAVNNNDRQVLKNPLMNNHGRYLMDFEDLKEKISDPDLHMVILCSPHNPIGRVWTRDELVKFGEICLDRDILVVSDEIHSDLTYEGIKFTPFGSLGENFAQNSIICTAPSKTFNLAGLKTSNIIIKNKDLREKFNKSLEKLSLFGVNPFGLVATETAYKHGNLWLQEVLEYVQGNYNFMEAYLAEHLPMVKITRPEGTYLVWVDFRALGLDKLALQQLILNKAGVYLDDGFIFGTEGTGFQRINLACRRSLLEEALFRITEAIQENVY